MEVFFSGAFRASLKKHRSLKKVIQKKVDLIIESPIQFGEPLKGNFRGYYSAPVKKNFGVIYLYCKICRKKRDHEIVLCKDCKQVSEDTIKFIDFCPHDQVYR